MKYKIQIALLCLLLIPCIAIAMRYNIDLVNIYGAAKFVQTDLSRVYAYNGFLGRYFYGPFSLILIKPFANYSYDEVKYFWILLQTVSYGIFWMALYRLYPILKQKAFFWGWILVWLISINPIHNNYQSNNIQLMLIAILLISELATYSPSKFVQWMGGILCVATGAIKVFPFFLAAYYFFTKPRFVKWGVLTGVVLTSVAPFLYFGNTDGMMLYKSFFTNLTNYDAENSLTKVGDILCLPSLVTRWMMFIETPPGVWTPRIIKALIFMISVSFFLWVRNEQHKDRLNSRRAQIHMWALACALMIFLNPSTRPHYFIFYIPAFCSVLEMAWGKKEKFLIGATVVSTFLIAFTTDFVLGKHLNDEFEMLSIPTFGAVLLCLVLGFAIYKIQSQLKTSPNAFDA